jgi:hypothetical protein
VKERLSCVLLAAELAETLRDQTFLGEKAHKRDRKRGLVAVHPIEILLGHVRDELLQMRDLANRAASAVSITGRMGAGDLRRFSPTDIRVFDNPISTLPNAATRVRDPDARRPR